MINYFFSYSGRRAYIDIVKSLDKSNIAKPSLIYGDPRLEEEFDFLYPNKVIKQKSFLQDFYKNNKFKYKDSSIYNFFSSKNYLTNKDQIFKMMDRWDPLGTWSRLDRESFLNKLIIFWFNKIKLLNPDILIFCDFPHTHHTYSLYIVAKYLGRPIYIINQWGIAPCVFGELVYKDKNKLLSRNKTYASDEIIKKYIQEYSNTLLKNNSKKNYKPHYMLNLHSQNYFLGRLIFLFKETLRRYEKGYLSKKRILYRAPIFIFSKIIKSIFNFFYLILDLLFYKFFKLDFNNPFKFSIIIQKKIINKKSKNLKNNYLKNINIFSSYDLNLNKNKYVYFSMQYEPEAATNPMGQNFYDQYLAILALREWLPNNIKLLVKEHPSQFFTSHAKGYLGRSQYFYDSLNAISGIYFVSDSLNSIEITKNSLFVASINGTISLEAVYLKKNAIYFGKPWYQGLPNTFMWKKNLNLGKILKRKIFDKKKIDAYLFKYYKKYAYPAKLNPSTQALFPITEEKTYKSNDYFALYDLINNFFKNSRVYSKKILK